MNSIGHTWNCQNFRNCPPIETFHMLAETSHLRIFGFVLSLDFILRLRIWDFIHFYFIFNSKLSKSRILGYLSMVLTLPYYGLPGFQLIPIQVNKVIIKSLSFLSINKLWSIIS